jgi:hypothetical protein
MPSTSRRSARQKQKAPSVASPSRGDARPQPAVSTPARRGRTVRKRSRSWRWLLVVVVAVVAGLGFALYRTLGRSSVGESIALLPATHVAATTLTTYNSNPPTSGAHIVETAPWGVSTTPLTDIALVHNLEHGGIVLHYRPDLAEAEREQLTALAGELQRRDRKVVLAPRAENDVPITATAWGRVLKQQSLNADELRTFFDAHINRGPERVP